MTSQLDLFTRPASPTPRVVQCSVSRRWWEVFDLAAEGVTYLGAGILGIGSNHYRSVRHVERAQLRHRAVVHIITHDDAERTTTVAVPREVLVILRSDLPRTSPLTEDA